MTPSSCSSACVKTNINGSDIFFCHAILMNLLHLSLVYGLVGYLVFMDFSNGELHEYISWKMLMICS